VQPEQFAELIRRAKSGDDEAFALLFRDTQPIVLRYLSSLGTADFAEDVAADAWLAVIRGLSKFADDDAGSFRAWVLTMARRRWVDEVRRRSRRHELLAGSDNTPDVVSSSNVEAEVEHRLGAEAARALVAQLPPDQAEVVTLRALAGLSVEQVARIVGKRPGAVRVLSHRGLRRLGVLLGGVTELPTSSVEDVT
jgi:RNA polymerase sigma-70 factor (ECF subfamily)